MEDKEVYVDKTKVAIVRTVVLGILIIWLIFAFVLVRYGENIRTNPCNFCAKLHGTNVVCRTEGSQMIFTPNGSIEMDMKYVSTSDIANLNFSYSLNEDE